MEINNKDKIAIFQIYAPTFAADKEEMKEFYKTLENCFISEREQRNMITGDFNPKIGNEQTVRNCVGPAATSPTNKNCFSMAKF